MVLSDVQIKDLLSASLTIIKRERPVIVERIRGMGGSTTFIVHWRTSLRGFTVITTSVAFERRDILAFSTSPETLYNFLTCTIGDQERTNAERISAAARAAIGIKEWPSCPPVRTS